MRLINELFSSPSFHIDKESLPYIVRDIINMNWWNTSGVLIGYKKNKRVMAPFTDEQKRIGVQLKEFYRHRILETRDADKFKQELDKYLQGKVAVLRQLGAWSMPVRANPSQYFTRNGEMTWVDCTSRATYATKYVFQNGFIDWDGVCRAEGMTKLLDFIRDGICCDLGIAHLFDDGDNQVKREIFSQKTEQTTVAEWVGRHGVRVLPEREWLLESIGHVRSDPFKVFEAKMIAAGAAHGVNEGLYGVFTSHTVDVKALSSRVSETKNTSCASEASRVSAASDASRASHASNASAASTASYASNASRASDVSRASDASHASRASDAGHLNFAGTAWADCHNAIKKPDGLEYPLEFRKNIFAMAGHWKIDKQIVAQARLGWFDPFMGHGSSPLYAARHGINYLGFDTNARAFAEYLHFIQDAIRGTTAEIRLQDSTEFLPELVGKFELCYTSPPYFNFEEYGGNRGHYENCQTYADFHQKITVPVFQNVAQYLVPGGMLALQLTTNKTEQKGWQTVLESIGWKLVSAGETGREKVQYSMQSKRGQGLLVFSR